MTDTPTTPTPGSDDYNLQMAALSRAGRDGPVDTPEFQNAVPEMPEDGHAKFYDAKTGVYNWQAHAKELSWKLSQQKPSSQQVSPQKPAEAAPQEPVDQTPQVSNEIQDVFTRANTSLDALRNELLNSGQLAETTVSALEKAGVPADLVREYATLYADRLKQEQEAAINEAGGQEQWDLLSKWAETNLDQGRKQHINALLNSTNWRDGLTLLKAAYGASPQGAEAGLVTTGSAIGAGALAFASIAEQTEAMSNPLYSKDPAYRAKVAARIAATRKAGGFRYTY